MVKPNFSLLPDPHTLKFEAWAAIVVELLLASSISLPVPDNEDSWVAWADYLVSVIPGSPPPSPFGFPEWQDWGAALVGTIS